MERIDACVLERSKLVTRGISFVKGYTAHLVEDVPSELLNLLLLTIMRGPMIWSSGIVVDQSVALDGKGRGSTPILSCVLPLAPWFTH